MSVNRVLNGLAGVVRVACVILLGLIVCSCVVQVVARYVFRFSFQWVEELATWSLVWITFTGSTLAVINGSHPRIDALLMLMGHRLRCVVEAFNNLVCAGVAVVLAYNTLPLVQQNRAYLSTGLRVPLAILYAALLTGGALMAVFFVAMALRQIAGINREEAAE